MHAAVSSKRDALAELCRRFHVRRLEVFGSATREQDFDPERSDADLLIEFEPDADPSSAQFLDLKEALEQVQDGRSIWWNASLSNKAATISAAAAFCRKRSHSLWRDDALLLDMLDAATEALEFAAGLDQQQLPRRARALR